jgi:8-oxo-dGTP pyrophosphatase MutT (NUDIX family)
VSAGEPAPPSGDGVDAPMVRAAGGAVWRRDGAGDVEVILVHRPRYDDWSLPKGKVDPGETDEEAALREVQEEASVEARIGPELPTTTYLDRSGKQKRVRYWAMTVAGGDPLGAHEVDEARWVPLPEARTRLTYPRDMVVLDALVDVAGE